MPDFRHILSRPTRPNTRSTTEPSSPLSRLLQRVFDRNPHVEFLPNGRSRRTHPGRIRVHGTIREIPHAHNAQCFGESFDILNWNRLSRQGEREMGRGNQGYGRSKARKASCVGESGSAVRRFLSRPCPGQMTALSRKITLGDTGILVGQCCFEQSATIRAQGKGARLVLTGNPRQNEPAAASLTHSPTLATPGSATNIMWIRRLLPRRSSRPGRDERLANDDDPINYRSTAKTRADADARPVR